MEPTITRREMIRSTAAGAVALAAAPALRQSVAAAEKKLEIIDAHVHIWSGDTKRFPPVAGFNQSDYWFPSYSAEELVAHGRSAGVTRSNLVQMTWYASDHTYILDVIAKDPDHFVGTGVVPAITDIAGPSPDRVMVDLSKGGIYAFRIRGKSTRPPCGDQERWMSHLGYEKMFKAGAEHRLALSFLMGPSDLPEVDRMCGKFPDTPVIIDHFCLIGRRNNFDEAETEALCRMAEHKNVMLKVGAFYALGAKKPPYLDMLPLIKRVVGAFGAERCMWESDAPLHRAEEGHTFQGSVDIIRKHASFLSEAQKEQILVKTAEDFFFNR